MFKKAISVLCGVFLLFSALSFAGVFAMAAEDARLPGDPDDDKIVSAADARLAQRVAVQLDTDDGSCMDINGDGRVTAADARLILRKATDYSHFSDWNVDASAYRAASLEELPSVYNDSSASFGLQLRNCNQDVVCLALVAKNCVGLESADLTVEYDGPALRFLRADEGEASQFMAEKKNDIMGLANGEEDGKLKYSFYIMNSASTQEEYKAGGTDIDADALEIAVFSFSVEDRSVPEFSFTIGIKTVNGVEATSTSQTVENPIMEVPVENRILYAGSCGENVGWTLNDKGVFTVSGQGPMTDYSESKKDRFPFFPVDVKSVVIEPGVTHIGSYMFALWEMESVLIPASVTSIGVEAFSSCRRLSNIDIPGGVTIIEDGTFYNCQGLRSVEIPDGVTHVGAAAFQNCTGLSAVTIPDSVTDVKFNAFNGCTGLRSVTLPKGISSIESSVFEDCTALSSVAIPDSVETIEYAAFSRCTGLKSITIPDGVKKIGWCAFAGCSRLSEIMLPDSVESIGAQAFYECGALKNVYYRGGEEAWKKISITTSGNDALVSAAIHFNAQGMAETVKESEDAVFAAAGVTSAELVKKAGDGAKVLKQDGSTLGTDMPVGSGMVLIKADGMRKTVIVKGDVNGDGKISAADARNALRQAVGLDSPGGWQRSAALVSGAEKVSAKDARRILRIAVGLEQPVLP